MADTANAAVHLITSVSHNAVAFKSPYAWSYQEEVEFTENRPAARIAPSTALVRYGLRATVRQREAAAPVVRGTSGDLVITAKQQSGSSSTITLSNMLAGAATANGESGALGSFDQEFVYNSGNTDSYAPIAVS